MSGKKAGLGARRKKNPNSPLGGAESFHCRLCDRAVRVPQGWTVGPAARRHYWRKHREVMQKSSEEKS